MINIFSQWFSWHFLELPKDIFKAWKNFLLFNLNYFSIPLLLKTLFYPWRKYSSSYGRGFDLGRYFEVFSLNVISRALGALVRTCLIIVGSLSQIFIIFIGVLILISWLLLPAFLVVGFLFGVWVLI